MEQAVYCPFTICLKWIIKVFKCFPCPFTVFNKTFKRLTYLFKKIGIHLMIWPNRSNGLPFQITCIRLTFLTKQVCKENSPEKHPLNTIAHAVIERLCCCSLQLTIFNSFSLYKIGDYFTNLSFGFVSQFLIIKFHSIKEYENPFIKSITHFFTKSNG